METAERFPRLRFGRRFENRKSKDAQITQIVLWVVCLACLCQTGCRSPTNHFWQPSVKPRAGQLPIEGEQKQKTERADVASRLQPQTANTESESGDIRLATYLQDDQAAPSTRNLLRKATDASDSDAEPESTTDTVESDSPDQKKSDLTDPLADRRFDSQHPGLSLNAVLQSVTQCYPEIAIAIGELEEANGKVLASWGEFDSVFAAHSISQPLGFYQTYRNGAGITRPLFSGGEVYGTYRIGDGNFEPWFGERETNEGGEFKAGFSLPLLKDRNIDARRAGVQSANANRRQVAADVETRLLQFQRFASQAYWDWFASGRALQIQQELLELANERVQQISRRVALGDLAEIAQIDNDRFIAKRKNDLIKARRSFEKAAIKMSLFLRDQECNPLIANDAKQLPAEIPDVTPIEESQRELDIQQALTIRPELVQLAAARRMACIDLQYAQNLTLPKLDMKGFAGQDVGGAASPTGDKTPFELQLGVYAEVPLQRREGVGKIRVANAKLNQIDAKLRLTIDKIRAEIQDASSAVNAAFEQIRQSQLNVALARRSLNLGRQSFDAGDIDLIALNIYESAVADAELQLLDAQYKYFYYLSAYQAARSGAAFEESGQ